MKAMQCICILAALAAAAVAAPQASGTLRDAYGYSGGKAPSRSDIIGNASSVIDGSVVCSVTECQMGNLVCDALLEYSGYATDAQACLTNADSINGSLAAGAITAGELASALPFTDYAIVLEVPGSTLKMVLEMGLSAIGNKSRGGRFPQIGGMNLTVKSSAPVGSRIQSLTIGGKPVVASKKYAVVTNDFLADGGYGFTWPGKKNVTGYSARIVNDIVTEYLKKHNPYAPARVGRTANTVVGKATAPIDGSRSKCRSGECQMADLLCDALLAYADADLHPDACFVNGGSANSSINSGDITTEEVYSAFPFPDYAVLVKVSGSTLRAALEHGLGLGTASAPSGGFPQVAGIKVTYSKSAPVGSRVRSVQINGVPLVPSKQYTLVTIDFLANGGDGYTWPGAKILEAHGRDMRIVVEEYLVRKSPYTPVAIPAMGGRVMQMP
jgi:2',3'-cyclic-nucleotide 2'-phosphodiesterase (5'-nucleotidase family)